MFKCVAEYSDLLHCIEAGRQLGGGSHSDDLVNCFSAGTTALFLAAAGWVTSGGPSPTLTRNIGLCYLPTEHAAPGKTIQIMIRNQPVDAVTVETPFYKRAK